MNYANNFILTVDSKLSEEIIRLKNPSCVLISFDDFYEIKYYSQAVKIEEDESYTFLGLKLYRSPDMKQGEFKIF